jgi:putative selenate reductase molybdopterin-binding subunit
MNIQLIINSEVKTFEVSPKDRLLDVLRGNGYFGVKHGCDDGSCGACAVLIDGKSINSCTLLAAQVQGKSITTIEGLGVTFDQPDEGPTHGWTGNVPLHPLQRAFVETGAIQCGYCTPAMILAAKSLLDRNPNPGEADVREVLSGVLCRCTDTQARAGVLRAAVDARRGSPRSSCAANHSVFNQQSPAPETVRGRSLRRHHCRH